MAAQQDGRPYPCDTPDSTHDQPDSVSCKAHRSISPTQPTPPGAGHRLLQRAPFASDPPGAVCWRTPHSGRWPDRGTERQCGRLHAASALLARVPKLAPRAGVGPQCRRPTLLRPMARQGVPPPGGKPRPQTWVQASGAGRAPTQAPPAWRAPKTELEPQQAEPRHQGRPVPSLLTEPVSQTPSDAQTAGWMPSQASSPSPWVPGWTQHPHT